nr:MAG TPA: hypothetical protein [Caudoviricetes sp.]
MLLEVLRHRNSKLIRKLNRIPGRIGYCPPPARELLIASGDAVYDGCVTQS